MRSSCSWFDFTVRLFVDSSVDPSRMLSCGVYDDCTSDLVLLYMLVRSVEVPRVWVVGLCENALLVGATPCVEAMDCGRSSADDRLDMGGMHAPTEIA